MQGNDKLSRELSAKLAKAELQYDQAKRALNKCREEISRFKNAPKIIKSNGNLSGKEVAQTLIKSQPGLFALVDMDGTLYWWNDRLEYYSGRSSQEIEKLTFLDFIIDDDREAVGEKIKDAFKKGETDIEIRFKNKNGVPIPFLITCVRVTVGGKDFIITTGLDISEKERERIEKMRYFHVVEKSSNEIFLFDVDTLKLIYVNERARKNLGYTQDQLQKMTAAELHNEFDFESFQKHADPLLTGKKDKLVYISQLSRSDKSTYKSELHLYLIEQDKDHLLVIIALDITERLKNEEKVKASLKEKEILLSEVHHRVKNNLAIVSSLINIQAQKVEEQYVRTQLRESESRIRSMAMIHQMLYEEDDFSKIAFNLYVRKMLDRISVNFHVSGARINTEVTGSHMHIDVGDAVPCALIINELITNCFKHAFVNRKTGKVQVALDIKNGTKKITVKDDGVGLPEDFKLDEEKTIGISLVKGLANQIGGTLEIDNNNGASFTVTF